MPELLIQKGYFPKAIFLTYLNQLEQAFDSNVILEKQHLYILKFVNCSYVIQKYLPNECFVFSKSVSLHLSAFERNRSVS